MAPNKINSRGKDSANNGKNVGVRNICLSNIVKENNITLMGVGNCYLGDINSQGDNSFFFLNSLKECFNEKLIGNFSVIQLALECLYKIILSLQNSLKRPK